MLTENTSKKHGRHIENLFYNKKGDSPNSRVESSIKILTEETAASITDLKEGKAPVSAGIQSEFFDEKNVRSDILNDIYITK